MRQLARRLVTRVRDWIEEDPFSRARAAGHAYPRLNDLATKISSVSGRKSYAWGVVNAAHLASVLGIGSITAVELGVASGTSLMSLDVISREVQRLMGVHVDVYGFDTGVGLPKPVDYRDDPHHWSEGMYGMDADGLRQRVDRAQLILGPVSETVPRFLSEEHPPIGFISFDLDYYSSTRDALVVFDAGYEKLMPRVYCYFDDILGFTYNDYTGERLAIAEFNSGHQTQKISPIYGLKYYVPRRDANQSWVDKYYLAHFFDHPLYAHNDGLEGQGI